MQDWQQIQQALKQHWGYETLRPPQDQVIRALLDKRDALVVLPTGFGKSLCFQLGCVDLSFEPKESTDEIEKTQEVPGQFVKTRK